MKNHDISFNKIVALNHAGLLYKGREPMIGPVPPEGRMRGASTV